MTGRDQRAGALAFSPDERAHLMALADELGMRFFSPPDDPQLFGDVIRYARQYVGLAEAAKEGGDA